MTLPPFLIDLILAGVAIEAAFLTWWLNRRRGELIRPFLLFLGSGALLLFAVRAAVADWDGGIVAASLFVAGILHILCCRRIVVLFDKEADR